MFGVSPQHRNIVVGITTLISAVFIAAALVMLTSTTAYAAPGINQQLTFQGRLFNTQGAAVPDGYYNVEFKIYQDGTGTAVGNPGGTLKWTESRLNSAGHGVMVKNGYMSVELGSVTPFGTSIDWNQDTIWLSLNIGNTSTACSTFSSCAPDGEMVPMKRMSASPYALNAAKLGGYDASTFLRSSTILQPANIAIQGPSPSDTVMLVQGASAQTADILQARLGNGSLAFNVTSSGNIGIGNAGTGGSKLDVSGSINTSTEYRIGGVTTLTSSSLNFSGTNPSNIRGADNQSLTIQGGSATLTNGNGGNLILNGGTGNGTGAQGLVVMSTPTFSTTTSDPNCFTGSAPVADSCTIAQSSVNNSAAILVGFSSDGKTATLPDPSILTAGRVVYVTASATTSDFTLSVNGGGQGNQIAMRKNTTATMIWNGNDWTAAGASSSTTLQAAYDNTLQSAGGAELIVSKTSSTNGLTIRDSSTSPVNGTLLSIQTTSAADLLSVNSNLTEYASNAGAETAGSSPTTFPANTWAATSGSTVSRYNTAGNYIATGQGSVSVATSTTAGSGVVNRLSSALTANNHYNISFATRLTSGAFTDLEVFYSRDGTTTNMTSCTNNKVVPTSVWLKVNCAISAPAYGITSANSIYIRQASAGTARTFYVDNLSVTIAADYNYAADGSVTDSLNFTTNWSPVGGAIASRSTTSGHDASDSVQVTTSGSNQGVRNKLAISPLPNTLYRVTAYAASTTSGFTSLGINYTPDNGSSNVACADYNTRTISSSLTDFTKITCYIQTGPTVASAPYVSFTQSDATSRIFHIDAFSMTLNSNSTPNVQIGGGTNGGPTTLFTLDRGASAPIASDNDALLGSMYYDTTLGKLQCYEADGWGACGSSPDNIVTLSPEYTNAVLHGTGVGTMNSDICISSNSLNLHINDGTNGQPTVCSPGETYNFYKWTSPQATPQTYSIYVTYQLPSTFKSFASGQTSLMGRTDSANSSVNYQIFRNSPSGELTQCGTTGSSVSVSSGNSTSWKDQPATGAADPSTCGFMSGDSIVVKINMTASGNASAYVGNLNFTFNNR